MNFINKISELLIGKKVNVEYNQKKLGLKYLKLNELEALAKEYISKNPKMYYKDHNGVEKSRKPTRYEYEEEICHRVPIIIILEKYPKLKKYINKNDNQEEL